MVVKKYILCMYIYLSVFVCYVYLFICMCVCTHVCVQCSVYMYNNVIINSQ